MGRFCFSFLACVLVACRSPERAVEHETRGLERLQEGNRVEAVNELRLAIDEDPGAFRAAVTLAGLYRQDGRDESLGEAVLILRALIERKPGVGIARMNLAELYEQLGLDDEALGQYGAAAALSPTGLPYLRMAAIYERRRDVAQAERTLLAASQIQPADPEPYYRLARLYDTRQPAAARRAWERYLALVLPNPKAAPERVDEAKARIQHLGSALGDDDARAALALLRDELSPPPPGTSPTVRIAGRGAVSEALRRPFVGRVFATVYAPGASEPVRGEGAGPTLHEAIAHAAQAIKQSRVYGLFVAARLDEAVLVIDLEREAATPLDIVEHKSGELTAAGFALGADGLEVRTGRRSLALLPSDFATRGLGALRPALEAALLELGLEATALAEVEVRALHTHTYADAAPGGGPFVRLTRGLPDRGRPGKAELQDLARGAANRLVALFDAEGRLGAGFDPVRDRPLTGPIDLAAQARVAGVLGIAAQVLGDRRLENAAHVAFARVEAAVARSDSQAFVKTATGDPDPHATVEAALAAYRLRKIELGRALIAWVHGATEKPLAGAADASFRAAAAFVLARWGTAPFINPSGQTSAKDPRTAWIARARDIVVERAGVAAGGELAALVDAAAIVARSDVSSAFQGAVQKLVVRALRVAGSEGLVASTVLALGRVPGGLGVPSLTERVDRAARSAAQLAYAGPGLYATAPMREPLEGHFRRGVTDPIADTLETARWLEVVVALIDLGDASSRRTPTTKKLPPTKPPGQDTPKARSDR